MITTHYAGRLCWWPQLACSRCDAFGWSSEAGKLCNNFLCLHWRVNIVTSHVSGEHLFIVFAWWSVCSRNDSVALNRREWKPRIKSALGALLNIDCRSRNRIFFYLWSERVNSIVDGIKRAACGVDEHELAVWGSSDSNVGISHVFSSIMTGNWGGTPVTRHHHPEWESHSNSDPGLQTFLLLYYLVETRLQTIFSVWRAIALIPSNQERRKRKINIGLCTSSDKNTFEVSVRLCRCCCCRWEVSSGGEHINQLNDNAENREFLIKLINFSFLNCLQKDENAGIDDCKGCVDDPGSTFGSVCHLSAVSSSRATWHDCRKSLSLPTFRFVITNVEL